MFVNRLIRYVTGSVTFEAQNGFCERLINLCAAQNILLWDFHKTDEGFRAVCRSKHYKTVCEFAERVNVEVTLIRQKGFFHKAAKYKRRWGLFLGIALFLSFLFLSQCYVWEIEVTGNQTVPTSVILNELESIGIKKFGFIPGMDFSLKKQEALLQLPQLSWLAINRNGCRLTVSVTERKLPPAIRDNEPCHIIASQTGQIRYMEVYSGQKQIKENYTVQKGEIIVSGKYMDKLGNWITVHADAKVIAEVQFEKTLSLDLDQLAKEYTGQEKTRYYLNLFSFKLPLFLAFPMQGDYDAVYQSNPISLFGQELPLGLDAVHYRFYEKKAEAVTQDEAREILENSFRQYEAAELKGAAILSREVSTSESGGVFSMTVSYIAEQDIAQKAEISP